MTLTLGIVNDYEEMLLHWGIVWPSALNWALKLPVQYDQSRQSICVLSAINGLYSELKGQVNPSSECF
jgi:hypothetical protein